MKATKKKLPPILLSLFSLLLLISLLTAVLSPAWAKKISGSRFEDIVVYVSAEKQEESIDVEKSLERIAQRLSAKLQELNFFPANSYFPGGAYWRFWYGHPASSIKRPLPIRKFIVTDKTAKKGHWVNAGSYLRKYEVNQIYVGLLTGDRLKRYFEYDSLEIKAAEYKKSNMDGKHMDYAMVIEDGRITRVSYPFIQSSSLQKKQYASIPGKMFSINYTGMDKIELFFWKDDHYPLEFIDKRHDKGKGQPTIFQDAYSPVTHKLIKSSGTSDIDAFFQYTKEPQVPAVGIRIKIVRANSQQNEAPPTIDVAMIDHIMEIAGRLVLEEFEGKPYRDPEKKGLPEKKMPLQVFADGKDQTGQAVSNGDILHQQMNFANPVSLPITVKGAQQIDGRYKIKVKVRKKHKALISIQGTNGAKAQKTATGYGITGKSDTVDFFITYNSHELQKYASPGRDTLLLLPIVVESGDDKAFFYNQIAPEWDIIITRFLVKGSGYEGLRRNFAKTEPNASIDDYRFNNYVEKLGSKLDEWNKIKSLAKPRKAGQQNTPVFQGEEQVVMGWEPYEPNESESQAPVNKSFTIAMDPPGEGLHNVPVYLANSRLEIELGLEIYQHPKIQAPATQEGGSDVSEVEEGFEEGEGDEAFFYENDLVTLQTIKELWNVIKVDSFALSVHKLNTDCSNLSTQPGSAAMQDCLDIRIQANDEAINDDDYTGLVIGKRTSDQLTDYFPLAGIEFSGKLITEGTPPVFATTIREPGIYEVRLRMTLKGNIIDDGSGERSKREIDVAIRIPVVPTGFDVKTIQMGTSRQQ
jgi:hypothetical protein